MWSNFLTFATSGAAEFEFAVTLHKTCLEAFTKINVSKVLALSSVEASYNHAFTVLHMLEKMYGGWVDEKE